MEVCGPVSAGGAVNICGGRLWSRGNFTHIWNASGHDLEITALTNVINEYRPGLESGSSDPETELPQVFGCA